MIIRIEALVDGNVQGAEETEFSIGDFTVNLGFEQETGESQLDSVSVERELTDSEMKAFTNTIEEQSEGRNRIVLSGYEELYEEGLNKLQTLESFFGLHGVSRVNWRNAKIEFIPQSSEEQKNISTTEINLSKSYPEHPHVWEFDWSEFDWELIEQLKVPLAFYRRGERRYRNFEYVSAFMEYYFVLEGLFAEGDWKNVEDRYTESDELIAIATTTLQQLPAQKIDELSAFFEFYEKEQTPEGYLRLITTLRHQLHHYFHDKSSGPHMPNPFDAEDYQSISLSLGHTVFLLLISRVNEIDYGED